MQPAERERLVNRIVSGVVPIKVYFRGRLRTFYVAPLTRPQNLLVDDIYEDALGRAEVEGLYSEDDLLDWLVDGGLWDEAREAQRTGLPRDIEKLKMGVYEFRDKPKEREQTRAMLRTAQTKLLELECARHQHDHLTQSGFARQARTKARIAYGLRKGQDPVYPHGYRSSNSDLIQEAVSAWHHAQIVESQFRELARTGPWRGVWSCRATAPSLFGTPACDYTDEQQQLVAVSTLYENIAGHPEAPPDTVIEDDDMLDGWLLLEQKKTAKSKQEQDATAGMSDKVKNSQEVIRFVANREEAKAVYELNSPMARKTVQDRQRATAKGGVVQEADLPDQKRKIQMEFTRLQGQRNAAK